MSAQSNHATPLSPDTAVLWLQVHAAMLLHNHPPLTAFGKFVLSSAFLRRVCTKVFVQLQDTFRPASPPADTPVTAQQADERQAALFNLWVGVLVDLLRLAAARPEAIGVVTHEAAEQYFFDTCFVHRGATYQLVASNALRGRVSDAFATFEATVTARGDAAFRTPNQTVTGYVKGPLPCMRTESDTLFASEPRDINPRTTIQPKGPNLPRAVVPNGVDPATYAQGLLDAEHIVGRVQIVGRPLV